MRSREGKEIQRLLKGTDSSNQNSKTVLVTSVMTMMPMMPVVPVVAMMTGVCAAVTVMC
jgi:hypothetical protein